MLNAYNFSFQSNLTLDVFKVWLDEFKENFYNNNREYYAKIDPGDLTEAKLVKESLNCKPFRYFLDQVAPDMAQRYPFYDLGAFASGAIQSETDKTMCMGWQRHKKIELFECDKNLTHPKDSQDFLLSWHRHIKMNNNIDDCITDGNLHISSCHFELGNQLWFYDLVSATSNLMFLLKKFVPEYFSNR